MKIFVISKYNDALSRIKKIIPSQSDFYIFSGASGSPDDAMQKIESLSPDVVIFALGGGDEQMLETAGRISVYKPYISLFVFSDELSEKLYSSSMAYGIHYTGRYPADARSFTDILDSVTEKVQERIRNIKEEKGQKIDNSSVIGIYATKDGVGKTMLSVNLAVSLSKRGKNVALIDMGLQFGDVCSYLNISPKKTMTDLIQDHESPSINDIEKYMSVHDSGIHILPAPKSPEYAEIITSEKAVSIIKVVKRYYDYVIVDLPRGMTDFHAELFKEMNRIYFIMDMQLSTIRNAKTAMLILNTLQEKEKTSVIINRFSSYDVASLSDIHNIFHTRIISVLPSDYRNSVDSVNRGIPIVTSSPKTQIAKEIGNLAEYTLSGDTELDLWNVPAKKRQSIYDGLRKKEPKK